MDIYRPDYADPESFTQRVRFTMTAALIAGFGYAVAFGDFGPWVNNLLAYLAGLFSLLVLITFAVWFAMLVAAAADEKDGPWRKKVLGWLAEPFKRATTVERWCRRLLVWSFPIQLIGSGRYLAGTAMMVGLLLGYLSLTARHELRRDLEPPNPANSQEAA